jgi:hypothetical protein
MRRLPTIAVLTLTLNCVDTASVVAAWPQCFSCSPSAAVTVKRDGVVLARGGMGGGGGMHCGPGCGGGGGGMGGGGGGMGVSGGGMGGGASGLGGWNPFMAVPRANCRHDRHKLELSQCSESR